jgi:tetratricopeptide (TPR) repeat protein
MCSNSSASFDGVGMTSSSFLYERTTGLTGENAMPFTKKNQTPNAPSSTSSHSVFVGRTNELLFFVQQILKPEEPAHNILSIWGQGGVGKTTLLQQFRNQAATADFKGYRPSDERLEVMLALASQRFFEPDEESHLQALFPLLDICEYDDFEQVYAMLHMLRKTVQILKDTQASSHSHQVALVFLRFSEVFPTQWDQTHKPEWLEACHQLLSLISHTCSPELLARCYDRCGWGHIRFREFQQALVWFERAHQLHPHCGRIQNGLGWVHYRLKEYQQALEHFNHGLEIAPHHPHLFIGRGKTYARLKAYQQALSDFSHATQLTGELMAYNHRGCLYLELQDYRNALADWDQWLEVAPEHPRAGGILFQQGCAYLRLKDPIQATICFTRSYELASTQDGFSWAQDYVLWAREWSVMCQTSPGPHTLHHFAAIAKGDHYTAYVCRGVIFFLQKEYQQALTALQYATTFHYDVDWYRDPWSDFWREWDAPFWLAMVYLALNQEEDARVALEQALAFEMPPILLRPLAWFEQEKPELYEQLVKPLFDRYEM